MERQKRTHLNHLLPCSHHHILSPSQPLGGEECHQTPGSCHGSFKDKRRDPTTTSWTTPYTQTSKDTRILSGRPCLFYLIRERIHHHIKKSMTNFRNPLEVRLNLAITLRHLVTGETYTSLQYHWLVGRTTICKFFPQVCSAILAEFQDEYFHCSDSPDKLKGWRSSEPDGMSPTL